MASPVILEKLNSIARCLERIESKDLGTVQDLEQNLDNQDILMLNLQRLVQLCVDTAGILISEKGYSPIPSTMSESFDLLFDHKIIPDSLRLRMKKAVGLRNLAVHEYEKINWEIIFQIVRHHLSDFKEYARLVEAT